MDALQAQAPSVPTERADRVEAYRQKIARRLEWHKGRVDQGLDPRCGVRLMTPDSASVVPDIPMAGNTPFAQFSLDSRDAELYAIAHSAARELVEYATTVGIAKR